MAVFGVVMDRSAGELNVDDHRLPLVNLREKRRELVMALSQSPTVTDRQISQIAALQQAIKAVEAVIAE